MLCDVSKNSKYNNNNNKIIIKKNNLLDYNIKYEI